MDPDQLDYPKIVQEALRDVVRRVLRQVAGHGIPGEHHFLIAFHSGHPGVSVPRFLHDLYPDEIKIIVQHQYWDLEVDDEAFSVTLSFNGQRQRLTVPFAALTLFVDPSAEFMLRFDGGQGLEPAGEEGSPQVLGPRPVPDLPDPPEKPGEVLRFDPSRRK